MNNSKIKMEAASLYPEDIDKYIEYKAPVYRGIFLFLRCEDFWVDMTALHDYTHKKKFEESRKDIKNTRRSCYGTSKSTGF
ncbi:hypothetical protein [Lachnobacterium bovis]|uniref:hypothetical protein n=1 Tax=Lachnobacterium bovis TaxID=140626 RepID=UPI002E8DDB94|nr:hypothetical protein [Lachnobacterium bovis]